MYDYILIYMNGQTLVDYLRTTQ